MEKENWISDVLKSTNGITKVVPDKMLFSTIKNAIKNKNKVSAKWVWLAAASFAILLSLNSWVLFSKKTTENTSARLIASTISKNNQLY